MAELIKGKTCADVWEESIKLLVKKGRYVPSIRGATIECMDVTLIVTNPLDPPFISTHSPLFSQSESFGAAIREHPRVVNWHGLDQMDRIVQILQGDPWSRRAVISIWDPREDLRHENPQGVIAFIFSIRDNALNLTSVLRTTDAWMCNWTLACIPELQVAVQQRLIKDNEAKFSDLKIGSYTQIHSSFHLYLDEKLNAQRRLIPTSSRARKRR